MVPEVEGSESEQRIVTVLPSAPARGVVVRRPRGGGLSVRGQGAPGARPWEASGSIDIERLAVWAYRDQLVDRFASSGLHAIEAEVAGFEPRGASTDGCATLAQIAHMGCRIDRRGAIIDHPVHPAAEMVAAALGGIKHGDRVVYHARLGGRPSGWEEPEPGKWFRAVQWRKPWVEAEPELFRGRPHYCAVMPTVTPAELIRRRSEYRRWWDALDQLAFALSLRALGFAVLRPTAPREPWQAGGEA